MLIRIKDKTLGSNVYDCNRLDFNIWISGKEEIMKKSIERLFSFTENEMTDIDLSNGVSEIEIFCTNIDLSFDYVNMNIYNNKDGESIFGDEDINYVEGKHEFLTELFDKLTNDEKIEFDADINQKKMEENMLCFDIHTTTVNTKSYGNVTLVGTFGCEKE